MKIPITRPWFGPKETRALVHPLETGWVAQGPEVKAFEEEFAEVVGAPHACAVSNGTTALHLALVVAGVGPGDEVVTVSHTFIATANAVRHCGATPIFVDVDPTTLNMDPMALEAALTPRTRAVLVPHQLGMPADLGELLPTAERLGIPVIEDAACALGSGIRWDRTWEAVGRPRGLLACFSFHPRKVITTGEGGMITSRRPELDRRLRVLRDQGRDPAAGITEIGWNARMTDLQAALGRAQLRRLSEIVARRRTLADLYGGLLATLPGITPPSEPQNVRSNWQSYAVRVDPALNRDALVRHLNDAGVGAQGGVMNAHEEAPYRDAPRPHPLHASEAARARCMLLPLFPQMTEDEARYVVEVLAEGIAAQDN
ncbi:MAG: DegT/DnrJ/EryC1/StrS family aminotransferase [Pseudomonadota bacterium]